MTDSLLRCVTEAEREAYERDGAVLLRAILPPSWLAEVRDGIEESYARPGELSSKLAMPNGGGEIRMDQVPSLHNARLHRFVMESPSCEIAAALLGSERVHHVLDQMFYKPAGTILPTAWHQDTPYLRVKGDGLCRLWIACDPSPAAATVSVVRGSHRWGVEFRPVEPEDVEAVEQKIGGGFSYDSGRFDGSLPKVPDIAAHEASFDVMSWDVQPGDVLAFNGNILHGNSRGLAHHPHPRRAFATLWGSGDVKVLHRPGHAVPDIALARGYVPTDGEPIALHGEAYPLIDLLARTDRG